MSFFDPRTISKPVYERLSSLRKAQNQNESRLKEQKNQAVELYTYLSVWGLLRLKAEEKALHKQKGKQEVVEVYFRCLEEITHRSGLVGDQGLDTLQDLGTNEYLGLTGIGLAIAREFSFWATAVYADIEGES